jgi:hypothetical protein
LTQRVFADRRAAVYKNKSGNPNRKGYSGEQCSDDDFGDSPPSGLNETRLSSTRFFLKSMKTIEAQLEKLKPQPL